MASADSRSSRATLRLGRARARRAGAAVRPSRRRWSAASTPTARPRPAKETAPARRRAPTGGAGRRLTPGAGRATARLAAPTPRSGGAAARRRGGGDLSGAVRTRCRPSGRSRTAGRHGATVRVADGGGCRRGLRGSARRDAPSPPDRQDRGTAPLRGSTCGSDGRDALIARVIRLDHDAGRASASAGSEVRAASRAARGASTAWGRATAFGGGATPCAETLPVDEVAGVRSPAASARRTGNRENDSARRRRDRSHRRLRRDRRRTGERPRSARASRRRAPRTASAAARRARVRTADAARRVRRLRVTTCAVTPTAMRSPATPSARRTTFGPNACAGAHVHADHGLT